VVNFFVNFDRQNQVHNICVVVYELMDTFSDISESTASASNGSTIPRVVKFAYVDFRIADGKWSAACNKCKKRLTDKCGVTTSFTK